jgi:ABC-type glycerol-3-phosphate transport system substrate-binding protein
MRSDVRPTMVEAIGAPGRSVPRNPSVCAGQSTLSSGAGSVWALGTGARHRQWRAARRTEPDGYGDQATQQQYDAMARLFEQRFAGRYHLTPTIVPYGEYINKATTMFASDTAPDSVNTWAQHKPEWVEKNLLLDLTSRLKGSKTANTSLFLEPMVDAMTWKGKLWGTAQDFNGILIYLNVDLFQARGVPLPAGSGRGRVPALARQLTDPEKKVFGTTSLANANGSFNFALLWNYGKHFWSDDLAKAHRIAPEHQMPALRGHAVPRPHRAMPTTPAVRHEARQGQVAMFLAWGMSHTTWSTPRARKGASCSLKPMLPPGTTRPAHFARPHLVRAEEHTRADAPDLAEWISGMAAEGGEVAPAAAGA